MKTRTILASVAGVLAVAALSLAADMQMGTWKLNDAKSKFPEGVTKNTTVTYSMAGDMIKVVVDGVDKDGKATHNEWTGKFDGKDYAVTGDPTSDMRSYKKVDDRTMTLETKKDGKMAATGKIVVAQDGKSRTLNTKTADGKMVTAVYDKQ
jgi:hypothetical protein